jgi:hypothetical protein
MSEYVAKWNAAWEPYAKYAATSNNEAIKVVVSEINKAGLARKLMQVEKYFGKIADYKILCSELKKLNTGTQPSRSEDNNAAQREKALYQEIESASRGFLEDAKVASEACAVVVGDIRTAAAAIKKDTAHKTMVTEILNATTAISNKLKTDMESYGTRIGQTLEEIRRAA